MGEVVDMTGRVLAAGESVDKYRAEQEALAPYRAAWDEAVELARYVADRHGLEYPEAVELIVHSLLQEAYQASEKHERAAEVLEFIGGCFYSTDSDSSESS